MKEKCSLRYRNLTILYKSNK